MKILSLILKIIETGMVCIWGVAVGILFPVFIMVFGEDAGLDDIMSRLDILVVWLITAAAGYLVPAALILGKHYFSAAVLSVCGFVGVLIVDGMFASFYSGNPLTSGPDELYLPLVFVTILDIVILAIEKREVIEAFLDNKRDEKDAKAPSILGDDKDGK